MNLRSLSAILLQNCLSGANLVTFFILVSLGHRNQISTATAIVGIAYAIAEAGLSVVAPRLLQKFTFRRAYVARCILALSSLVFLFALCVFSLSFFIIQGLPDVVWVASYAFCVWTILLAPSWLGANFYTPQECFFISIIRLSQLPLLFIWPNQSFYLVSSLIFFLLSLYITSRKIGFPLFGPRLRIARLICIEVRLIFSGKTLAYITYSAIPITLNWIVGPNTLIHYLLIERIKSLYSSAFAPIIQLVYITAFTHLKTSKHGPSSSAIAIGFINIVLCCAVLISEHRCPNDFFSHFFRIESKYFILGTLAAAISVQASLLLHFSLALRGLYVGILVAAIIQMLSFAVLVLCTYFGIIDEGIILVTAEFVYFASLIGFVLKQFLINKSIKGKNA